jgi:hypothetical protein
VFEYADATLGLTSSFILPSKAVVYKETLERIQKSFKVRISDLIKKEKKYLFSAICIQSKNRTSASKEDDARVHMLFSGMVQTNIPCISIKHVLRMDKPIIKGMDHEGLPCRHGLVIHSWDVDKMIRGPGLIPKEEDRPKFMTMLTDILEAKPNQYVFISELDLKLQCAAAFSESVKLSERLFTDAINNATKKEDHLKKLKDARIEILKALKETNLDSRPALTEVEDEDEDDGLPNKKLRLVE